MVRRRHVARNETARRFRRAQQAAPLRREFNGEDGRPKGKAAATKTMIALVLVSHQPADRQTCGAGFFKSLLGR